MPQFDRPIQRSFALGEQSDTLAARADLDRWGSSLALCQNCVTLPTGGATKRSGTQRIAEALANSHLYDFRYSRSDGYAIEAAALKFRFFRDYGMVLTGGGDPYELVTPFTADEVPALSFAQSADVAYIASGTHPIQKLSRFAHNNWTIDSETFNKGPFMAENTDESIRLYTTHADELVAGEEFILKAFPPTAQVWTAANVGGLFLIREQDGRIAKSWLPDNELLDPYCRWNGNIYKAIGETSAGAPTGGNPPIHTVGAEWDGLETGILWEYKHSGYGIVRITGFTNAHQVTAEVISYVPGGIKATETLVGATVTAITDGRGSNRWAEGAWSARRGYPRIVVLHQDRLIAYSTPTQPSVYWGSCTDDFPNFLQGSKATDAFARQVNAGDGISEILWAISSTLGLALGTNGPEVVTRSLSSAVNIKPDDIQDIQASNEGAAPIRPVAIDAPVFVSANRRRVHTMALNPDTADPNAFVANNLTVFADHITRSGVAGLTWQRDPFRLLWAWRQDGRLVALTYDKQQQVMGWHRHPMEWNGVVYGKVKSGVSVPSPSGTRQDLWLRVERELPAGTKTYIEALQPFFEEADEDETETRSAEEGWFVDCGVLYEGAPITEITEGLADFEGMDLWVLADGQSHGLKRVTDGEVTLDRAASKVLVGIPFDARLKTLIYDRAYDGGANSGRKQRVPEVAVRLKNSAVVNAGALYAGRTEPLRPTGGQNFNTSPTLFSGIAKASVAADWDNEGVVEVVSAGPFPMTVQSITPATESAVN